MWDDTGRESLHAWPYIDEVTAHGRLYSGILICLDMRSVFLLGKYPFIASEGLLCYLGNLWESRDDIRRNLAMEEKLD